MPRRTLKRWLPDPTKLKESKSLKFVGHLLHEPGLWHLNRKSVAKAFFLGLFMAMMPIPIQIIVTVFVAIWLNANMPISISLVWLTNPLTMPAVFYFNYVVGNWLLGAESKLERFELSIEWITSQINAIFWPLLTGSIVTGIICGGIGYFAISGFWHWHVRRNWRRRSLRRAKIQD